MRSTLGKQERLKSKNQIDALFDGGRWLREGPLHLVYHFTELNSEFPAQATVAVPKSVFRKAVMRNRYKRYMREAYRQQKEGLYRFLEGTGKQCALMFIYKGKDDVPYSEIEQKICALLRRLLKEHG